MPLADHTGSAGKNEDGAQDTLTRTIHLELWKRSSAEPGIAFLSGFASEQSGAPPFASVHGSLTEPAGPGERGTIKLRAVPLDGGTPQPKPKGRPRRDGRCVAAYLAFALLTDCRGMGKEAARDKVAELLNYSDARAVRRLLSQPERIKGLFGGGVEMLVNADAGLEGCVGAFIHPEASRRFENGRLHIGPPFWLWRVGDREATLYEDAGLDAAFEPTVAPEVYREFIEVPPQPTKGQ